MRASVFLALTLLAALSLSACGQRVDPKYPEGKTIPSTSY
jgi:predicted small lipoprotein YifL